MTQPVDYAGLEDQVVRLLGPPREEVIEQIEGLRSKTVPPGWYETVTAERAAASGDIGEALEAFHAARELDPGSAVAEAGFVFLNNTGDGAGRIRLLRELVEQNPDLERPRYWLAAALVRVDPTEASRQADWCVSHRPVDARAWVVLARARLAIGDRAGAHEALATALGLTEDSALQGGIIQTLFHAGYRREAFELARSRARTSRDLRAKLLPLTLPMLTRVSSLEAVGTTAAMLLVVGGLIWGSQVGPPWLGIAMVGMGCAVCAWWLLGMFAADLLRAPGRVRRFRTVQRNLHDRTAGV